MTNYEKIPNLPYTCYELNGILCLPHYTQDCYVMPGENSIIEVSEAELLAAGAIKTVEYLWKRSKF
jgi:hypothetical protein